MLEALLFLLSMVVLVVVVGLMLVWPLLVAWLVRASYRGMVWLGQYPSRSAWKRMRSAGERKRLTPKQQWPRRRRNKGRRACIPARSGNSAGTDSCALMQRYQRAGNDC